MSMGLLAGVYIDRERVRLIVANLEREHVSEPLVDPVVVATGEASFARGRDWTTGAEALDLVVMTLEPMARELIGAAVASYGPFVSLDRGGDHDMRDARCGELDPDRADPPFAGLNPARVLEDELRRLSGRVVPVMVQTDAATAALGEAWFRNIGADEVLTYLILDRGIGGGWVKGRQVITGALHPEMGLSSVSVHPRDPLRMSKAYRKATSVGGLARLSAMLDRARALDYEASTLKELVAIKDERLWVPFHNYVAQLCLTCTAMLPPHQIVIGGALSKAPRCLQRVRAEFEQMWDHGERGAALQYGAVGDDLYISAATMGRDVPSELAGTIYLAYKAAGYGSIKRFKPV